MSSSDHADPARTKPTNGNPPLGLFKDTGDISLQDYPPAVLMKAGSDEWCLVLAEAEKWRSLYDWECRHELLACADGKWGLVDFGYGEHDDPKFVVYAKRTISPAEAQCWLLRHGHALPEHLRKDTPSAPAAAPPLSQDHAAGVAPAKGEAATDMPRSKEMAVVPQTEQTAGPDAGAASSHPQPAQPQKTPSVVLHGQDEQPEVLGQKVEPLKPARYNVVTALLNAGKAGMTKDRLAAVSGHTDAVNIAKRLHEKFPDTWGKVIQLAGVTGGGYRIG